MLCIKRSAAVAAILLAAVGYTRADVLDKLPDSTMLAIKVSNLEATSGKVARLAKDFGMDGFVPAMKDPLSSVMGQAHMQKGVKKDGELGVAVMSNKLNEALNPNEPAVVILVPVSNYQEFLTNFENAKTEDGVTEFSVQGEDKPSFTADWGEYAAVSQNKALLAKPAATLKVAGFGAAEAKRQDMLFYANFAKITPEALPELEKGLTDILKEIDNDQNKEIDAKWKPVLKAAVTQFFGVARGFLNDANSATYGVNISDAGINLTVAADFKPESYTGKHVARMKGTDASLTAGLPQMKYHAFGGASYDSAPIAEMMEDFTLPIIAELNKIEGQENVKGFADSIRAAMRANHGSTFGMPVPAKIGQDAIFQQLVVYRGGGKETKTAMTQGADLAKSFIDDIKAPEGQQKPKLVTDASAKTIDGVAFDTWKVEMPVAQDDPNAAMQQQMMTTMYGAEGLNYSFATIGKNDLLLATSAKDETISAFLKSIQANEDVLSKQDHVKAVKAELPKTRMMEAYLALDEIVNTGIATATTMGMPVQIQLPPDLSPIGFTGGAEGTTIRFDVHVPSSTIQALIAAGMQAAGQMRGGGGGNL